MPELLERPVAAASPARLASASRPPSIRAGGEVACARLALGVVALHAVDDAFLNPEPGTSAGDHLASGLVPVVLLVVLAWSYPRMRAWWQSVPAISVGLLALLGGVAVSGRHVVIDRLAGDDVTGIAAGLAGIVLVVCGALAAKRAVRPRAADRSLAHRYGRRALLAIAVAIGALFVVGPVGMALLATHKARAPVHAADLGRPYQAASFYTSDHLVLRGWYVPSRNGAAVIVFPGRTGTLRHARMLARHGYGVLVFDRRGEGESEGDFNSFGWSGEADLVAAARWLAARPDVRAGRVGGLGLSVGGEVLLQTAAHSPLLHAVVADGAGYRSIRDHLAIDRRGPISWISPLAAQTAATAVLSNSTPPPALSDLVGHISPRAGLFIWAGRGTGGENSNPEYYTAAKQPKQIWKIPEAGHTGGLKARPREYERRVAGFFDRYLLGR